MPAIPYSKKELFARGPQLTYAGRQLDEIAFPLGGIGTGSISLGGWGQLRSWEIRNRPARGEVMPHGFFAVRVRRGERFSAVRVLQGTPQGSRAGTHSAPRLSGEGLPCFREVRFHGEFPVATVVFSDPEIPLQVSLEAFNPFIPLDAADSSIPVAVFLYHFRNTSRSPLDLTVVGNVTNFVGPEEGRRNEARSADGLTGLLLTNTSLPPESAEFGSLVLATPAEGAKVWPRWPGPRRPDTLEPFWRALTEGKVFPPRTSRTGERDTGSVAVSLRLGPGRSVVVPFLVAWYFPTVEYWGEPAEGEDRAAWRNYYATVWADAWEVAQYTVENLDRLREETLRFRDTLFTSTLPRPILEAVSSQMSTLKSPTCLRLTDGTFYGFEGCGDDRGCCEGSCSHVWNYAQVLPYLFPDLQRSMLEAFLEHALLPDGFVTFRLPLPLGRKAEPTFHPAADGQMGQVVQAYREWQLRGDLRWLERIWPRVKKVLEFAFKYWDANRDGVMEGMQHNTYDVEFYGPNTMTGSLYLCALRAAEEMARALGRKKDADRYRALFEKGSAWTDKNLFNGQYYIQQVNPGARRPWPEHIRKLAERHGRDGLFKWPKWQFGTGCLSDQLIGQWYAAMLGLGHLYKPANVRKALQSIFKYNWRASLRDHPGLYRLYAFDDEPGLVLCTWPKGGRPGHPFYYCDEVWCGVEYQVASHLIYEGLVAEGLAVATGVRKRHNGEYRNPFDEAECGRHYARSMSSYALLLALSGFHYSAPDQRIQFDPRVSPEQFRCFFCVPGAWGLYSQRIRESRRELAIEVRYGSLTLRQVTTSLAEAPPKELAASLDRTPLAASAVPVKDGVAVVFPEPVTIDKDQALRVGFA